MRAHEFLASLRRRRLKLSPAAARTALAHRMNLAQVSRGLPSGDGRRHFFEAMSFSMAQPAHHRDEGGKLYPSAVQR